MKIEKNGLKLDTDQAELIGEQIHLKTEDQTNNNAQQQHRRPDSASPKLGDQVFVEYPPQIGHCALAPDQAARLAVNLIPPVVSRYQIRVRINKGLTPTITMVILLLSKPPAPLYITEPIPMMR